MRRVKRRKRRKRRTTVERRRRRDGNRRSALNLARCIARRSRASAAQPLPPSGIPTPHYSHPTADVDVLDRCTSSHRHRLRHRSCPPRLLSPRSSFPLSGRYAPLGHQLRSHEGGRWQRGLIFGLAGSDSKGSRWFSARRRDTELAAMTMAQSMQGQGKKYTKHPNDQGFYAPPKQPVLGRCKESNALRSQRCVPRRSRFTSAFLPPHGGEAFTWPCRVGYRFKIESILLPPSGRVSFQPPPCRTRARGDGARSANFPETKSAVSPRGWTRSPARVTRVYLTGTWPRLCAATRPG